MHPAIYNPGTMTDEVRDRNTLEAGTLNLNPDVHARQSDYPDTEINTILKRFGLVGRPDKPRYTVTDFDLDLQTAIHAVREVRKAHDSLSPELRKEYGDWTSLAQAIDRGEITIKLGEPPKPEATTTTGDSNEGTNRNTSLRDDSRSQAEESKRRRRENRAAREADRGSEE